MANYVYETHIIQNPLLPFIFHKEFVITTRNRIPNWHENIEILFCIGGSGYVSLGQSAHEFSDGDLFVINADTPHIIHTEQYVSYRCLIIDNSFCLANGIPISSLNFQASIRDKKLAELFEQITSAYDDQAQEDPYATAQIRSAVLRLLLALWKGYAIQRPAVAKSAATEHIKKALTYIRAHMTEPIRLDDLSTYVGISKYHLAREFKTFTGNTIIHTVNLIRCAEAKRLIEGGMSISAAAMGCGYENLSYFTRTFKRLFQVLPSQCLNTPKI